MISNWARYSLVFACAGGALAACGGSGDSTLFGKGATGGDGSGNTTVSTAGPTTGSTTSASSGAGGASSGGGGQGGSGGCKVDGDCADGLNCTIDTCDAGKCSHKAGPTVGPTACPAAQFCDVLKGCVPAVACATTADCVTKFGGDACKVDIACDPATSVCVYQTIDDDMDGHPPIACGGDDCDDDDPSSYPGAPELCDGKDNNCNGVVDDGATCGGVEVCQTGTCVCPAQFTCGASCVDTTSDHDHCGSCANACAPTATCVASKCVCPGSDADCSGQCVNLKSDVNNCNSCGLACPANAACNNGACACNPGLSLCSGQCADKLTDENNCGACGVPCNGVCQGGVCNVCPESDLFVMQDTSGSTTTAETGGTRLEISQLGIEAFMSEAKSSGLGLGIGYHPVLMVTPATCATDADCGAGGTCFPPTCFATGDSCSASDYAVPIVPIALLPGVSAAITSSIGAQVSGGGSPVANGLQGALMYAKSYALANPTHKVAVVLVTDGMPNECTPNTDQTDVVAVAAPYLAGTPKIPTYIIGLGTDVTPAQLNAVAVAGGTGMGYVANSNTDVQTAFESIRDTVKTCP